MFLRIRLSKDHAVARGGDWHEGESFGAGKLLLWLVALVLVFLLLIGFLFKLLGA